MSSPHLDTGGRDRKLNLPSSSNRPNSYHVCILGEYTIMVERNQHKSAHCLVCQRVPGMLGMTGRGGWRKAPPPRQSLAWLPWQSSWPDWWPLASHNLFPLPWSCGIRLHIWSEKHVTWYRCLKIGSYDYASMCQPAFEKERRATTLELPLRHDGNAISQ